MRSFWLTLALALGVAPMAAAERHEDLMSGLSFEVPDSWTTSDVPVAGLTYLRAIGADQECHFFAMERPATAEAKPRDVRLAGKEALPDAVWQSMPTALAPVFHGPATFQGQRLDETQFWPIQWGEYAAASGPVHAAVQFRPGMEYWSFCRVRAGADQPEALQAIMRTVRSTHDAELQAAVEEEDRRIEARAERRYQRTQEEQRMLDSVNTLRSTRPSAPSGPPGGGTPGGR